MASIKKRTFDLLSLSLALGMAAAIGALLFFAWLTNEVLDGETRHFDQVTRDAVHQFASPMLTAIMRGISFVGSSLFLTIATIAMFAWFMSRRWRRDAWLFGITMLGAAILNTTLKLTFRRPRPVPFFNLLAPESYSFPSGHSLASFCFFGALATILTARINNTRINLLTWLISGVIVLLIGLSRIYLGVHYTTDVLAGFAAALIWIAVIRFLEMQFVRRRNRKEGQ
ncbi:MAG TPA: phosphatase PAP2 family protein [Pyrinomonadaceae bacterium]|nr:phosphatase PAP2 family protein [Pyrinomonadaceae bacterium]